MADVPQTILPLAGAKSWLRILPDDTDNDADVLGAVMAAEGYLTESGCALTSDNPVAIMAIKMKMVDFYENRDPGSRGSKLDAGLSSLINQLQLSNPDNVVDDDQEGGDSLESGASSQ